MPLITSATPERWEELEELVTAILNEAGLAASRQVKLDLPRGYVDVDVYAEETVDGIVHGSMSNHGRSRVVHTCRSNPLACSASRHQGPPFAADQRQPLQARPQAYLRSLETRYAAAK